MSFHVLANSLVELRRHLLFTSLHAEVVQMVNSNHVSGDYEIFIEGLDDDDSATGHSVSFVVCVILYFEDYIGKAEDFFQSSQSVCSFVLCVIAKCLCYHFLSFFVP